MLTLCSLHENYYVSKRNEAKVHVQLIYILGIIVHVNDRFFKKLTNVVRVQIMLKRNILGMFRFTNKGVYCLILYLLHP